jgi:hypothetical protein
VLHSVFAAALFYGDEPDPKTERGLSVIGMNVADESADEVFAACVDLDPLQQVRITFDVARGGKNLGKNSALHIEAAGTKPAARAAAPQAPAQSQQQAKPAAADPAKG